uniref:Uncharacterized protein n=1 Tax=Siphoviridae sp. ctmHK36 TaxID=2827931 RepID=A0A8S5TCC5_9CAUD|nr:MAG TPA: hypothetical protein [Siphoviridae sp. ctmHK36]
MFHRYGKVESCEPPSFALSLELCYLCSKNRRLNYGRQRI